MSLSLNRTIGHLKSMMASMKDLVFPLYSDVKEDDAQCEVYNSLRSATDYMVADAFLPRIPEIKRMLELDVKALMQKGMRGADACREIAKATGFSKGELYTKLLEEKG